MTALSPLRVGRVTGSRIAAVLGASPYATAADVKREMIREAHGAEREFTGNAATRYGQEHESDALDAYETTTGWWGLVERQQQFFIHPVHRFLGATPDGLIRRDDTGTVTGLVEVKCPWRGSYTHITERPDYELQVRLQMEVTGARWCDFVVWRPEGSTVSRVEHDPWWLPTVLPAVEAFLADVEAVAADEGLAAPYLAPLVDERNDQDWADAAAEWLEADAAVKAAQDWAGDARARLVELADEQPSKGAGVQVLAYEKKGTVDHAAVVKELLPDADLGQWKREPSRVVAVRRALL